MLQDVSYYARAAVGLARYQCAPRQEARSAMAALREQLHHREERFLHLARHVLGRKNHPYRRLFDLAGCSYADLEAGVQKNGLRATLARLLEAGVYVTHEEFRGRIELVRHGAHIARKPADWSNPWGRGINPQSTSGSSGRPFVTNVGNQFLRYQEGHETLEIEVMHVRARARVLVGAILPSTWPVRRLVTWDRLGVPVDRWFAAGSAALASPYRAMTALLVSQMKLLGGAARYPEFLPPNDFTPVAECLAHYRAKGRPAYVRTTVSMATRIAVAARDSALDIRGTLFSVSGEPLSALKRATIESAGAGVCTRYGATEFGEFGFACTGMTDGDSVHLYEDSNILLPHRLDDATPNALFVTNLLPWGPRILINTGIGDSAVIEEGTCDCEFQRLGFSMQARNIFSNGKVTSQGMLIAGHDLAVLVETALPERFGGSPGDYQLAEIDGALQSEVRLRVSPRVRGIDPGQVEEFFLSRLSSMSGGSLSERLWRFSHGFQVVREEPEITSTGKVHPLRLLRPVELFADSRNARTVV